VGCVPWGLSRAVREVVVRPETDRSAASEVSHVGVSDVRVDYVRNGEVRLAYRVFGESGPTVIWVPGWVRT
jgi:hypothetical protein